MKTTIGVDQYGVVRLISDGAMPGEWNGIALRQFEFEDDGIAAFHALPPERIGTFFDGQTFFAIERPAPVAPEPVMVPEPVTVPEPIVEQPVVAARQNFFQRFISFFRGGS